MVAILANLRQKPAIIFHPIAAYVKCGATMDKAIYLAMSSGQNIMSAQAIHANNLANANTNGFQADFAQARAMGVYYGDGHPTRAYAMTESPGTDFNKYGYHSG